MTHNSSASVRGRRVLPFFPFLPPSPPFFLPPSFSAARCAAAAAAAHPAFCSFSRVAALTTAWQVDLCRRQSFFWQPWPQYHARRQPLHLDEAPGVAQWKQRHVPSGFASVSFPLAAGAGGAVLLGPPPLLGPWEGSAAPLLLVWFEAIFCAWWW